MPITTTGTVLFVREGKEVGVLLLGRGEKMGLKDTDFRLIRCILVVEGLYYAVDIQERGMSNDPRGSWSTLRSCNS